MHAYSLTHLSDGDLLRDLDSIAARDRGTTAELVAHIAEVDSRRLYLPAGYPSMYEYCVRHLHMSEHESVLRIRAGRTVRKFPAVFSALADGRLHLSAVVLLKRHLTRDSARELIAAATHRTKAEIELLIAERFPQPDLPTRLKAIAPPSPTSPATPPTLVPAAVPIRACAQGSQPAPELATVGASTGQLVPERVALGAPNAQQAPAAVTTPYPKVTPRSAERFAVQFTMDEDMHDRLRHVQELLGHQIPSGDIIRVFDRALKLLERELEKQKFAATDRPRTSRRCSPSGKRTIPAHVQRAVWKRDQGQCTFVSDKGHRCGARKPLEFDHMDPVARGGEATVESIRLRCRAHNQYEAERVFGDGFMNKKREAARLAAQEARARAAANEYAIKGPSAAPV